MMMKTAALLTAAALLAPLSASAATAGFVELPKPPGQCITAAPSYACAATVWLDLRDITRFRFVVQSNVYPNPPVKLVLKHDGGCLGERCVAVTIASSLPSMTGGAPIYASPVIAIPPSQRKMNVRLWLAIDAGTVAPPMTWGAPLVQFYR